MSGDQEWYGRWRPPDGSREVGGQLTFTEGSGARLVLFGTLADWSGHNLHRGIGFPLQDPMRLAVIHGHALGAVTALECETSSPLPPFTTGNEGWSVEAVVDGHVQAPAGGSIPVFGGLSLRLDALAAWSRAPGLRVTHYFYVDRTDVSARGQELAGGRLADGTAVRLVQSQHQESGDRWLRLSLPVDLIIEPAEPAGWRQLLNDWLQPIQALLWVAFAETSRVDRIELLVPESDEHPESWRRLWVPLVDRQRSANPRLPIADDTLFCTGELPGGFVAGLDRWFGLWAELRHVLGPVYARANAPFAYANDRYYTAAAAIEAYHRYCVDSERDLDRQAHRQRVARLDTILAAEAPDLRNWGVNAARPFNHLPWWKRITAIAEPLPRISEALFGPHLEFFARQAEAARHGHAHALEEAHALNGGEALYLAADGLVWLLRTCIMIDLGFDVDLAQSRVLRHQRFRHLAQSLRRRLDALVANQSASSG